MTTRLEQIYYYPIKGLSGTSLETTHISTSGIPNDRALAFVFEDSIPAEKIQEDVANLAWLPKSKIAVQNDWPGLAALKIEVSHDGILTIQAPSKKTHQWDINKVTERMEANLFVSRYLNTLFPSTVARHPLASPVVLAGKLHGTTRFPDRDREHVSILNMATLKDIEKRLNIPIDIKRFRGNLLIDDLAPWEEYTLKGKNIKIGDVELTITNNIVRCHNINVHPSSGEVDVDLLPHLKELCNEKIALNFAIFGILGQVQKAGHIKRGDALS